MLLCPWPLPFGLEPRELCLPEDQLPFSCESLFIPFLEEDEEEEEDEEDDDHEEAMDTAKKETQASDGKHRQYSRILAWGERGSATCLILF